MLLESGIRPPLEGRQPKREILTRRVRPHEHLLSALPSNLDLAVARQACKVIWDWRDDWSISKASRRNREMRGLFASVKGGE